MYSSELPVTGVGTSTKIELNTMIEERVPVTLMMTLISRKTRYDLETDMVIDPEIWRNGMRGVKHEL